MQDQFNHLKIYFQKTPRIFAVLQNNQLMGAHFILSALYSNDEHSFLSNISKEMIDFLNEFILKNDKNEVIGFSGLQTQNIKDYHIVNTMFGILIIRLYKLIEAENPSLENLNSIEGLIFKNQLSILKNLSKLQLSNGSFTHNINAYENDLRFVFAAVSICHEFQNFDDIKVTLCKNYIISCYNYDGGFGMQPEEESHCKFCIIKGSAIYLALSSLRILKENKLIEEKELSFLNQSKTLHFLSQRITELNVFDVNLDKSRPNKDSDTCYIFWISASIRNLDFISEQNLSSFLFNEEIISKNTDFLNDCTEIITVTFI